MYFFLHLRGPSNNFIISATLKILMMMMMITVIMNHIVLLHQTSSVHSLTNHSLYHILLH